MFLAVKLNINLVLMLRYELGYANTTAYQQSLNVFHFINKDD